MLPAQHDNNNIHESSKLKQLIHFRLPLLPLVSVCFLSGAHFFMDFFVCHWRHRSLLCSYLTVYIRHICSIHVVSFSSYHDCMWNILQNNGKNSNDIGKKNISIFHNFKWMSIHRHIFIALFTQLKITKMESGWMWAKNEL